MNPADPTLVDVMLFRAGFNTALVVGGTSLLGLAGGVVGVFAMLRKRAMVADALSHAALPGIVVAFLVASTFGFEGRSLPVLLAGAAVFGVLGVLCIQGMIRYTRLTEDAAIGIVLSVFFGAGVVGLSYVQENAPAGSAGLTGFIFGQAATMLPGDVWLMAGVACVSVLITLLLLKEFTLVTFNDAFARVTGWNVGAVDLVMMAMVVLVTIAGMQAVGLIMVVAMLIIPPVAARFWTNRIWLVVVLAGVIGAASGYVGAVASAMLPRKPAGAIIVLAAGGVFVLSMFAAPARGIVAAGVRRLRLRMRIASDHLLEAAYEHRGGPLPAKVIDDLAKLRGWSRFFRIALLWRLQLAGFISERSLEGVSVSPAGLARGARVNRNHALWEQYLVSYADVAPNHVDWSVDQVEHVLTDDLIQKLESRLSDRGIRVPRPSELSA